MMSLLGQKAYCSNEEDQEVVMEESAAPTIMFPFSSSSSSSSSFNHKTNNDCDKNMELSLGNNSQQDPVEKKHMFDKVVTPSDVGKLNRLVIPKQHAERYFPLDSSSNEKGLLLNFEDRSGKPWRFRYSYWNSSQSYVMTKGWSRFVKDKKLDAGDIVSFQRGVSDHDQSAGKIDHLYYIDWRRRPEAPDPITSIQIQNHYLAQAMNWSGSSCLNYSSSPLVSMPRLYNHEQYLNNYTSRFYPYHQNHQVIGTHGNNYAAAAKYYLTVPPIPGQVQIGSIREGVVIDSVPIVHGRSSSSVVVAAKRGLRLFGVNMECSSSSSPSQDDTRRSGSGSSSSEKGKCSNSLSFDLDL